MKIAIASGKGGTGKTTVATNLAIVAVNANRSVGYLDCDVEEPNGAIFLKPNITETRDVNVSIPSVDIEKCTSCGKCGEICEFNAIVVMGKKVLVFPELCHSCAGCWLVCPAGAISESYRKTGRLDIGKAGDVAFVQGLLDIGQTTSPPVIEAVKKAAPDTDILIIDSPPGTSCPVIASIRDSDYVLLVTEPTPFGLNDLKLAVEMTRVLELPLGVVINRAGIGDDLTTHYCQQENINILAEIPDDRQIAHAYSRGEMICQAIPKYKSIFTQLVDKIIKEVSQ